MSGNSSPLSLLTVLNPGGSSFAGADSGPVRTIDQMVELMRNQGLEITDEHSLRKSFYDCNYYRLSGYFRVFQNDPSHGDNRFLPGTRDRDFLAPYERDGRLRSIVLRGTARLELTLRSRFVYLLSNNGGAYIYMEPESYRDAHNRHGHPLRDNLLRSMDKWLGMSNEMSIRRYRRKGQPIPVWAAVETFPFDTLSKMLSLHTDTVSLRTLYRSVGLRTGLRTSSEIVHAMVYLRNLCSHHGRLWHREMVIPPPTTRDMNNAHPEFIHRERSAASSLSALAYLVAHIDGNHAYRDELDSLLDEDVEYRRGITNPLRRN